MRPNHGYRFLDPPGTARIRTRALLSTRRNPGLTAPLQTLTAGPRISSQYTHMTCMSMLFSAFLCFSLLSLQRSWQLLYHQLHKLCLLSRGPGCSHCAPMAPVIHSTGDFPLEQSREKTLHPAFDQVIKSDLHMVHPNAALIYLHFVLIKD